MTTIQVPLYRAAHGRTGDKGDRSNISVIAWHADLWPLLLEQVTIARVAEQFRFRSPRQVSTLATSSDGAGFLFGRESLPQVALTASRAAAGSKSPAMTR